VRTLGAQNVDGRSQNETDGFRAEVSHALLKEGNEFLDSIVTGDETWGFHHTPESLRCKTWFKGQSTGFYASGIQKLVPRLNKCLDIAGDSVEK
jgi:hypothetical protein